MDVQHSTSKALLLQNRTHWQAKHQNILCLTFIRYDPGIDIYTISILQLPTHHKYVISLADCGSRQISYYN